jgi:hypothetical protein
VKASTIYQFPPPRPVDVPFSWNLDDPEEMARFSATVERARAAAEAVVRAAAQQGRRPRHLRAIDGGQQ